MQPNTITYKILEIIRDLYFSFWIKNIYLKIKDPNERIFYQKLCLTGIKVNLDWPKSENAPLNDIKAKFIFNNINEILKHTENYKSKIVIIQVGSSSGRVIANIANKYKNAFCIGIDYINEYIEYSKSIYSNNKNLIFIHKSAHNINEVLDLHQTSKIIIFSIGSSAYIQPEHLMQFFKIISKYKKLDFLLAESFYKKNFNNDKFKPINFENYSTYNGGMHYSHKYYKFSKNKKLILLHNEINEKNNTILCRFKT